MDAVKLVQIGAAVLVTVLLIGVIVTVASEGKDTFSTGNDQLVDQTSSLSTGKYDINNNSVQAGGSVIQMINSTFREENLEVLVCTKDGNNYVYNSVLLDAKGKIISTDSLTGMPTYDATGKPFNKADAGTGKSVAAITKASDKLMCSTGYDSSADVSTAGYIASTSIFNCTVQKDVNGNVRRLTYVQK